MIYIDHCTLYFFGYISHEKYCQNNSISGYSPASGHITMGFKLDPTDLKVGIRYCLHQDIPP